MDKGRLLALTDGIVAIAATVMVLELAVPEENTWAGLMQQWHVLFAYVISFFMIYTVWYEHHNLFKSVETITPRVYLANGIWIFFLTLVPFTTAWVGSAPNERAPELLYALDLLLWSASFQFLDYQLRRVNPDLPRDATLRLPDRILLYGGFSICIIMSFIQPIDSMYIMALITLVSASRLFVANRRIEKEKASSEED